MKTNVAIRRAKRSLFVRALAEEHTPTNPEPTPASPEPTPPEPKKAPEDPKPSGKLDFEQLIAQARREERDKLYKEIEKLKASNNDYLAVIGEQKAELAELRESTKTLETKAEKLAGEVKTGIKSNTVVAGLQSEVKELKEQLAKAIQEKESEVARITLENYKEKAILRAGDSIIPELVGGSSQEEIDASIQKSQERFQQIVANSAPATIPGSYGIPMPTIQQSSSGKGSVPSPEAISRMTPAEFAKVRAELGLK